MDEFEAFLDEVVNLEKFRRDQDVRHALNLQWLYLGTITCSQNNNNNNKNSNITLNL